VAAALILVFSTLGAFGAALSVWLFDAGIAVAAVLYAVIGIGIPAAIVIRGLSHGDQGADDQ
jgi:hypothetical protein